MSPNIGTQSRNNPLHRWLVENFSPCILGQFGWGFNPPLLEKPFVTSGRNIQPQVEKHCLVGKSLTPHFRYIHEVKIHSSSQIAPLTCLLLLSILKLQQLVDVQNQELYRDV